MILTLLLSSFDGYGVFSPLGPSSIEPVVLCRRATFLLRSPFGLSSDVLSLAGGFSLFDSLFPLILVNFRGWRFCDGCDDEASPASDNRSALEARLGVRLVVESRLIEGLSWIVAFVDSWAITGLSFACNEVEFRG